MAHRKTCAKVHGLNRKNGVDIRRGIHFDLFHVNQHESVKNGSSCLLDSTNHQCTARLGWVGLG